MDILVVAPELFRGKGGVQRFSQDLVATLDGIIGSPVSVLVRNDRPRDIPSSWRTGRNCVLLGGLSGRVRTVAAAVNIVRRRPRRMIFAHPWCSSIGALCTKSFDCEYVVVAHGIDVWHNNTLRVKWGLAHSRRIWAVSRFTADKVRTLLDATGCPGVEILHNMVDTELFKPLATSESCDQRDRASVVPAILTVGRVNRTDVMKGYSTIVRVLARIAEAGSAFTWTLVGGGDALPSLRAMVERYGLAPRCRLVGEVEDYDLRGLYASSDIFILPSKKEGFGIVFLEAAASGLQVIAGSEDGSRDALRNGELGVLVAPANESALADALGDALAKVPRWDNECRRALNQDVDRHFGRDAFTAHLKWLLQGVGWS